MKCNFEYFIWFHPKKKKKKHDAKNTTVMFNFPKIYMVKLICWVN